VRIVQGDGGGGAPAQEDAREARYRLIFENSPLPKWVYDVDTLQFVEVNAAAIAEYGYSRDELLAMIRAW
jgi:PAS domain S-box-containing protein